jgi:hypothetical protein
MARSSALRFSSLACASSLALPSARNRRDIGHERNDARRA